MSVFTALNTGVTGLGSNGLSLEVIGDNIANLNTTAFKGSRAEFRDLMFQDVAVAGARGQVGLGSFLGGVSESFAQGSLEATGRDTDFAVNGDGFFVFRDAAGTPLYSRSGALTLLADGTFANPAGMVLQGYQADGDGAISSTVSDLVLDRTPMGAEASTGITLEAQLDPDEEVIAGWTSPLAFASFDDASAAASTEASTTIYDSLGVAHTAKIYFVRTSDTQWEYHVVVDQSEVDGTSADGTPVEIGSGTLDFDGDGNLSGVTAGTTTVTFQGAASQALALDFGDPVGSDTGAEGSLTMQADGSTGAGDANTFYRIDTDGHAAGEYSYFTVGADGTVTAVYDNDETLIVGQVVLATFQSVAGLERAGNSMYLATKATGEALLGAPGDGSRGEVSQYTLEGSNVDLEEQFVKMITAQRGYEASAKVISTADEMLRTLTNTI